MRMVAVLDDPASSAGKDGSVNETENSSSPSPVASPLKMTISAQLSRAFGWNVTSTGAESKSKSAGGKKKKSVGEFVCQDLRYLICVGEQFACRHYQV